MEESAQVIKISQKHFLEGKVLTDKCLDLLLTMHNKFHLSLSALCQQSDLWLSEYDSRGRTMVNLLLMPLENEAGDSCLKNASVGLRCMPH